MTLFSMSLFEPHLVRCAHRAVALAWRQNFCRSSSTAAAHSCDKSRQWNHINDDESIYDRETSTSGLITREGTVSVSPWWESTSNLSQRAMSLITESILGSSILWMAAPKRKTTPSRKGMRSSSKYVKFVPVVSQCSKCSRVFPPHAMPSKCEEEECPAFPNRKEDPL